jgi:peptidoglycan/LPS O-acetylase OafA/YrhL
MAESPSGADLSSGEAGEAGEAGDREPRSGPARSDDAPGDPVAPFHLGNRPPLTGIRAFVIATILIYHSNFRTLPGAWSAISVFFVLSGFLITSMLMGEHRRNGRISIGHFYARRALRLLPPLLMTVALLGLYAAFVYVPDAGPRIWGDVLAAVFYYADFRSATGHEPFLGYLAQAWSLSIEEQFYVAWSLLLLAALALGKRTAAYGVAIAGVVASITYASWTVITAPHFTQTLANRVYFGFGTRIDALFVGCVLGLVATGGHLSRPSPWLRRTAAVLGLVAAGVLALTVVRVSYNTRSGLLWWLPISIVASAFVIIYFVVSPRGWGSRFVGLAPFVLIGNLTYTIYLVHWPVYVALSPSTTGWSYWPLEGVRLAIIGTIALLSWYLVERPLMRWRRRALA